MHSSSAASHTAVVLRDDVEVPYASKDDLLAASKGVYTTARTIDKTFVMEFDAHLKRTVESCLTTWTNAASASTLSAPAPPAAVQATLQDPTALRPHLYRAFHSALHAFHARFAALDCERRITLLLDWAPHPALPPHGFSITTYTEPLPPPPAAPVEIKLGRAPPSRHGKVGKDAQWTRDRQGLEAQMGSANEVVMVDAENCLMEGTQSNVYVVMDNKVYWPDREDILEGTVRKVVRRVCEAQGIPYVATRSIPLHTIGAWQGVFLTSTSRLVLPVSVCTLLPGVALAEAPDTTTFHVPSHPLVGEVARLVRGDLKTGSVDVAPAQEQQ